MRRLPLSIEHNDAFSCLPEYALQNIVDNFKFVFRYGSYTNVYQNKIDLLTCSSDGFPKSSLVRWARS